MDLVRPLPFAPQDNDVPSEISPEFDAALAAAAAYSVAAAAYSVAAAARDGIKDPRMRDNLALRTLEAKSLLVVEAANAHMAAVLFMTENSDLPAAKAAMDAVCRFWIEAHFLNAITDSPVWPATWTHPTLEGHRAEHARLRQLEPPTETGASHADRPSG